MGGRRKCGAAQKTDLPLLLRQHAEPRGKAHARHGVHDRERTVLVDAPLRKLSAAVLPLQGQNAARLVERIYPVRMQRVFARGRGNDAEGAVPAQLQRDLAVGFEQVDAVERCLFAFVHARIGTREGAQRGEFLRRAPARREQEEKRKQHPAYEQRRRQQSGERAQNAVPRVF